PMRGVMRRLRDRLPHAGGGADHAVEPRVVHHLDDGGHTAPFVPDETGPRAVELDLGRRVGPVPELVLEALEPERVPRAVGPPAREEEAREAALRLRQDEEHVAHRRREEPLVAGQLVLAGSETSSVCCIRAYVEAALLL